MINTKPVITPNFGNPHISKLGTSNHCNATGSSDGLGHGDNLLLRHRDRHLDRKWGPEINQLCQLATPLSCMKVSKQIPSSLTAEGLNDLLHWLVHDAGLCDDFRHVNNLLLGHGDRDLHNLLHVLLHDPGLRHDLGDVHDLLLGHGHRNLHDLLNVLVHLALLGHHLPSCLRFRAEGLGCRRWVFRAVAHKTRNNSHCSRPHEALRTTKHLPTPKHPSTCTS